MYMQGAFTALITPFKENNKLDLDCLAKFVEFQISSGINGLVPAGSTGEAVCLDENEHLELIRTTVNVTQKRVPVIAGIGSNDTAKSIRLGKNAAKAGADAVLAVLPFYNRPPNRGIIAHFKAIAAAVNLPLLVYNVPKRTASDITIDAIKELATVDNIFGIKDASGDLSRVSAYKQNIGKNFLQFCGEDHITDEYYQLGGNGSISVISNIIPKDWAKIYSLSKDGNSKAQTIFNYWKELLGVLACDTNPIPIKYAVHKIGFCKEVYRLPLVPLTVEDKTKIDTYLKKLGLI